MSNKMLRREEVEARCGIARTTVYRLMRAGQFPTPFKNGNYIRVYQNRLTSAKRLVHWFHNSRRGISAMTTKNAPGKFYRKGMTLVEVIKYFDDETNAEAWFVQRRWPNGITCPSCDSAKITPRKSRRKTPQYHCNGCQANFTAKTGTIMHDSKLPLSKWAQAFYLFSTNLKGVSSMKLHRDLGITQKSAWFMAHRIRETWNDETEKMAGPVEVDETYVGGKERNKHADKKLHAGRGAVGKTPVAGVKDRATNQISATVISKADKGTLQDFVSNHVAKNAKVYTDDAKAYSGLPFEHKAVKHSVGEYVDGDAHTNGIEAHWATFKRAHKGTFHKMSPKHLQRYVTEFAGRHNIRPLDTIDMMRSMANGVGGKRLQYADLIADNGLESGARS